VLCLERVSFRFADRRVIDNVNLEIPENCFMALIGPNGGGKTTLLRLMSRALRPESGRVLLGNKPIEGLSARQIAQQIAVISSEQYFEFPYRVKDVVAMGRFPHLERLQRMDDKDAAVVEESMQLTDVLRLSDRPVTHLSSGERQRVYIARALAQQPVILMLDEPNAHLDIHHQIAIFELLRTLRKTRGISVLAVLHDLNSAAAFCEQAALLCDGRLVKVGTPKEVITSDLIRQAYGVEVSVCPSPLGGYPQIMIAPGT
jgi:iron complex transport system ATP-binding protein